MQSLKSHNIGFNMKVLRLFVYFICIFTFFSVEAEDELTPDVTVLVPMRDGTALATDLYLPSPEAKGLPCILLRSPAGRQAHWKSFAAISKLGYVVAIQETRSAADSEGKTFPFLADGWGATQDGYDTVEWLAKSPYTNGKIGTWGSSASGITELLMAPSAPPSLQCQYIMMAASSLYHHALFPGGQLLKNQAEGWLGFYARDTGVLSYVCQRPFYNDFWRQLDSLSVAHLVQVPALHYGGWYDTFLQGTLEAFKVWQEHGGEGARGKQKLIIGPWTHYWPASKAFGDFKMPEAGMQVPIDISPERWFAHYLKGEDNGINRIPPVLYYVMGPFDGSPSSGHVWRASNQWPIPAEETPFYLTAKGTLQDQLGDAEETLSYVYDPSNPIPTLGGRNLFLPSGPVDQQSIENRSDILVFTTDPLEEDVEVTGFMRAKIFFTSDQADTDVVVRLCDVYPDGKSVLISDGAYRVGVFCHSGQNSKVHFDASKPLAADIDLWATSLVFAKGHRIRVSVSSSNFPRFEKNLNLGLLGTHTGRANIAKNTLFFGKKYPSHVILPIVRKGQFWLKEPQPLAQ
jgi:uncharacterized protein